MAGVVAQCGLLLVHVASLYEQEVFPNPATLRLDVIVHKGRNLKKTKMEKREPACW